MKKILNRLINHEVITKEEARDVLINISNGMYNSNQIAAFLTVYMIRTITVDELEGFRDALLELCIKVDLENRSTIDLCGTGGDEKDTFNISTLASFITAGAGIQVLKHGNYGVSSTCGSSNVMEYLGIKFTNKTDHIKKALDTAGICILHAPLFHPAMKKVASIRKELGVKTFFNMLGPMVNPANPSSQMIGVFSLELARIYGYLYQNTTKKYTIVHALDGYDEISLTCPTKVIQNNTEQLLKGIDFGVEEHHKNEIKGGHTIADSAKIFMNILNGKGTNAQNNVVCANAGMAIATANNKPPKVGFEIAKESLLTGKALNAFKALQKLTFN